MSKDQASKLQIRSDRPTAISSSVYGANLDAIGFNIAFIASKNPKLAVELISLYIEVKNMKDSDPKAPEEDYAMFVEALKKLQ